MVLWRNKELKSYFREIRKQLHIISVVYSKSKSGTRGLQEVGERERIDSRTKIWPLIEYYMRGTIQKAFQYVKLPRTVCTVEGSSSAV